MGSEVPYGTEWAPGLPCGTVTKNLQLLNCAPVLQVSSWTGITRSGGSGGDRVRTRGSSGASVVFTDKPVDSPPLKLMHCSESLFLQGHLYFGGVAPSSGPCPGQWQAD